MFATTIKGESRIWALGALAPLKVLPVILKKIPLVRTRDAYALSVAQAELKAPQFGHQAQTLQPDAVLKQGQIKLS